MRGDVVDTTNQQPIAWAVWCQMGAQQHNIQIVGGTTTERTVN
jgi:hypothetical protein